MASWIAFRLFGFCGWIHGCMWHSVSMQVFADSQSNHWSLSLSSTYYDCCYASMFPRGWVAFEVVFSML